MSASGTSWPLLVHPEPAGPVGGEEPGVSDAPAQPVHGLRLAQRPGEPDRGDNDENPEDDGGDAIADAGRNGRPAHHRERLA